MAGHNYQVAETAIVKRISVTESLDMIPLYSHAINPTRNAQFWLIFCNQNDTFVVGCSAVNLLSDALQTCILL